MTNSAMMDQCRRAKPPPAASEAEMAGAMLDWQRATFRCKLDGLTEVQQRQTHPPSTLTLLWLLKHLAAVERFWFQIIFAGAEPNTTERNPFLNPDPITPDDMFPALLIRYDQAVAASREIVLAAASLDDLAQQPNQEGGLTLRWIVFHMIEETARHNGHADLIREAIDGQVGQ